MGVPEMRDRIGREETAIAASEVSCIEVFDGNTGESFTIQEPEEILSEKSLGVREGPFYSTERIRISTLIISFIRPLFMASSASTHF